MCKYTFHQSSTCHQHQHSHSHYSRHHHHSHSHSHHSPKTKNTPKNQPCQWIQIAQPCGWGRGLLTCPTFASNALRIDGPNVIRVVRYMCPTHDWKGVYDRNMVKMVVECRTGGSWFGPPDIMPEPRKKEVKKKVKRKDDVKLCVVM